MYAPQLADPHEKHVVFYSGGAVAGAFGAGLQEESAHGEERCPDVYVVNSAGLPNALARVAAEHELITRQANRRTKITPEERAEVIREHHARLWGRIENDFKHFLMPDTALGESMTEALHSGWQKHFKPFAAHLVTLQASAVALNDGAHKMWRSSFDPWNITGFWTQAVRTYARDAHFWALYLRSVFPNIDEALAHPDTPRILAQAYNVATQQSVLYDSRPASGMADGLSRLVGSMCIIGQVPLVDGLEADGGYTGFNGDNFDVVDRLIAEDPSYASARITFVNLGPANLGTDATLHAINPHYAQNKALAARMKADVMRRHPFREFALDRTGFRVADKFSPRGRVIADLKKRGRQSYWQNRHFSKPAEAPLTPAEARRRLQIPVAKLHAA